MTYQFTPNMIPLAAAALISAALAWYTWRHRRTTGAVPFSWMMWILFQWGISYILQLAATDIQSKLFWADFMFIGVVATPVAWLAFALEYTGRKAWMTRTRLILLLILPLVTISIIFTNGAHKLFRASESLAHEGGFLLLKTTNGPWFWVHAG